MLPFKLRALLFYLNHLRASNFTEMQPEEMRTVNTKYHWLEKKLAEFPSVKLPHIEDKLITVRDNTQIPIRIYKPSEEDNLKVIMYYHGGGFVINNINTHDDLCRSISKKCNAIVISVGYRLAPEFKFPIPIYDSYDALIWASKNCQSFGGNKDAISVMGDSAGGNIATVLTLMAKQENGPKIDKQVLIYPCIDARLSYPSIETYKQGYLLTKELMVWFVNHYQSKPDDILNPYMSPILANDLSGLPEAFVCTSDHDPLKDEGEDYYKELVKAGNKAQFKEYKNTIHAFANMPRITKQALVLVDDIARFMKKED